MFERRPSGSAVILEDQDESEARVALQVLDAFAKRPQHPLDMRFAHGRQRLPVFGRLDDDFMRADAVHAVEHALALTIEVAFDLQRRKLVRHDAQVPAGAVAR